MTLASLEINRDLAWDAKNWITLILILLIENAIQGNLSITDTLGII